MFFKIFGTIITDIFALYLVLLKSNLSFADKIQTTITEELNEIKDSQRWSISMKLDKQIQELFFQTTFFIPGLISIITLCGLILVCGYRQWLIIVIFLIVILYTTDIYHTLSKLSHSPNKVVMIHKYIIIILIIISIVSKILLVSS